MMKMMTKYLVGCSSMGTKLERIEANEAAIADLQARPEVVVQEAAPVEGCTAECEAIMDEKLDRMFEKSMYK